MTLILEKLIATAEAKDASEHSNQIALFAWFAEHRKDYPQTERMFAIPNANSHSMVSEGVRSGVCDICVPWPTQFRHGLYVELKTLKFKTKKNGGLSPEQIAYIDYFNRVGYSAYVAYGWVEACNTIINYLHRGA